MFQAKISQQKQVKFSIKEIQQFVDEKHAEWSGRMILIEGLSEGWLASTCTWKNSS